MKRSNRHDIFPTVAASFRLGWSASPRRMSAIALFSVLGAGCVVMTIAAQKWIVDAVESYIGFLCVISVPVLFIVFRFLLQSVGDLMLAVKSQIISLYSMDLENRLMEMCAEKTARIDLLYYEDAGLYDQLEKARAGGESVAGVALTLVSLVTSLFSTLIGVAGYLMYLNPILSLILLFSLIPSLVVRLVLSGIRARVVDETAAHKRSLAYAAQCITSREFYKETRVLGAFEFFISRWDKSRRGIDRTEWRYHTKGLLLRSVEWTFLYLGYACSFLLAARSLFTGDVSIGAFAAVLASFVYVQSSAGAIVADLGDTLAKGPIARAYFQFLDLPERCGGNEPRPDDCEIRVEDVSFTYPSTDRACLSHVDLTIHPGETLAIVGANGAGKTTLSKIIIGLLKPQNGRVHIGNVEVGDISEELMYRTQSAVFQDFGKYKMTIRENVALDDRSEHEACRRVEDALSAAGFDLSKPEYREEGIETLVAPEFGGIDLSGGEWQLIALARSRVREHSFVILDEPTSSIDPIREAEIYRQFIESCREKTALIITHRLGAATLADRIVFMESGRICETGTHRELMSANGQYASMFRAQAKWYRPGRIGDGFAGNGRS